MEPNPERITWLTFIGWLVLALVIAMFATPIALWVGAANQPTVIRIAIAIFCACIVQRLLLLIRHAGGPRHQALGGVRHHRSAADRSGEGPALGRPVFRPARTVDAAAGSLPRPRVRASA